MANKNAVSNYEQQFYLSGILLSGVTSLDGGYSIDESPINIIGKGYTYPVRQNPLVGNFNISKYYIGKDPLLDYTGDSPISGSINYGGKSFGFNSGFLTDYSFSASISSIPTANASIVVYGDIGSGINASGSESHPPIQIPNQGSMSINASGYQTNRVTQFSYGLRIDRKPLYKIGSPFPVQVDRGCPMTQNASFSIDVDELELTKMREYLISPKQQDLEFVFSNPVNGNQIEKFEIKNARLTSQSIRSSSDDILTAELQYVGYINKK
jgi:hypothetical protein